MVKKNKFNYFTGMDFWFKPKPSQQYFQKKRNHCLRNTYDIKNMQLYHNLVKNWGSTLLGASATITLILFMGPKKLSPFFYHYKKDNTFNHYF